MIRKFSTVKNLISASREGRMLRKLVEKRLNKEKTIPSSPKILSKSFLPSAYENEYIRKRQVALDKMFMEKLTEMMNEIESGNTMGDLKIEITKVKLHHSYEYIDIFWISRRPVTPEKILKETLQSALRQLQEKTGKFTSFRKVPLLRFIRDVRLENEINLDEICKMIDLGKNFHPVNDKKVHTTRFTENPDEMPVMRQNILGVDVEEMKGRIMAQVNKFKAINFNTFDAELVPQPAPSYKLIQFNRKDFFKYYKRNRISEMKMRKKEKRGDFFHEEYQLDIWNKFDDVYDDVYNDINNMCEEEQQQDECD